MSRLTVGLAAAAVAAPMFVLSGTAAGIEPDTADCGAPPTMPPLSFAEPKVIDSVRAGGEPSVEGLPDGNLVYAAHASTTLFHRDKMPDPDYVTPYTGATYVWRSTDGGDSWKYVGLDETETGPHAAVSGFSDPDFAVDLAGNVYTSGINLANVYVAKSSDSGATWRGNPAATVVTDREWLAADEADVVYLNGNQLTTPSGVRRLWKSTDGGATFDLANPVTLPGSGPPSKSHVDQADGRLFFPDGNDGIAIFPHPRDDNFERIDVEIDGGTPHAHGAFNDMAIDDGRNVYVVSNTQHQILVSWSDDGGLSWKTTVIHDTTKDDTPAVAEEVLWPWISAGADGRVGVSWYQADRPVTDTETTPASYRVLAAQTITGHGWTDACGQARDPVYEVATATPDPFHTGAICSSGTTCQAEVPDAVDRRLGDYHTNSITADGSLVIAYSDTSLKPNGAISHPGFIKQSGGVDFAGEAELPDVPADDPAPAEAPEVPAAPDLEVPAIDVPTVPELPDVEVPPIEAAQVRTPIKLALDVDKPFVDDTSTSALPAARADDTAEADDADVIDSFVYSPSAPEPAQPPDDGSTAGPGAVQADTQPQSSSEVGRETFVRLVTRIGVFTVFALGALGLLAVVARPRRRRRRVNRRSRLLGLALPLRRAFHRLLRGQPAGLEAGCRTEFGHHRANPPINGPLGHVEMPGDRVVAEPGRHELEQ